jgi:hypothetical protein
MSFSRPADAELTEPVADPHRHHLAAPRYSQRCEMTNTCHRVVTGAAGRRCKQTSAQRELSEARGRCAVVWAGGHQRSNAEDLSKRAVKADSSGADSGPHLSNLPAPARASTCNTAMLFSASITCALCQYAHVRKDLS